MTLCGVSALASGCVTKTIASVDPILCPPLGATEFQEYEHLSDESLAPALRAWIRETEKRCRANEEMYNHDK